MSHLLLYNKPHGNVSGCTLAITGTLPGYQSSLAYEGRLQVSGARGSVTLTSWTGALPPGAQVSYDSGAEQIVVTWPAYSPGSNADIPNLDFQSGDVGFADGAGIDIRNIPGQAPADPSVPDDTWYMHYQNVGGESNAMSQAYIRATPGKTYTASVDLWRASTRKHADGGAVRILFYDANKNQIDGQDGNVVKEQTDRQWHTSSVSKVAPANAAFVRLGVSFFRIHDNDEVLAANLQWNGAFTDGTQAQGTDAASPYPVTFSVRDSMGCRATWTGTIQGVAVSVIADLDFESGDFTDKTGRVWTVQSATITDRWGLQPVQEPTVVPNPAGSGLVMSKCPDTAVHDGTFDYLGYDNLGLTSALGTDAFGANADFWIDMDVRLNVHGNDTNDSKSFLCLTAFGGRTTFGARGFTTSPARMENTVANAALIRTSSTAVNIVPGQWFHFSASRQGDTLTCSVNGTVYATYSGASAWSLGATTSVIIGNGQGGGASTDGWPGQVDNILILRGVPA